jgi:hypothetical protein
MADTNLPVLPYLSFPQIQQALDREIQRIDRIVERELAANPPSSREYVMVDLCGNILQARRMSPSEARDTNLELEALEAPYYWTPLAEMFD